MLKSALAIRPIFNWTARRVKARKAICLVPFSLLHIVRYWHNSMHGGKKPLIEVRILLDPSPVEASVIRDGT